MIEIKIIPIMTNKDGYIDRNICYSQFVVNSVSFYIIIVAEICVIEGMILLFFFIIYIQQ